MQRQATPLALIKSLARQKHRMDHRDKARSRGTTSEASSVLSKANSLRVSTQYLCLCTRLLKPSIRVPEPWTYQMQPDLQQLQYQDSVKGGGSSDDASGHGVQRLRSIGPSDRPVTDGRILRGRARSRNARQAPRVSRGASTFPRFSAAEDDINRGGYKGQGTTRHLEECERHSERLGGLKLWRYLTGVLAG